MITRIKHAVVRSNIFGTMYALVRLSALAQRGWLLSNRRQLPIDRNGRPIPWYTYPAIDFLLARLPNGLDVLEFGCGYSTLWWMERARRVFSIESNADWANAMRRRVRSNVTVAHVPAEQWSRWNRTAGAHPPFDVIVIDGEARNECAEHVTEFLKPNGFVIWDNSDRPEYAAGFQILYAHGFKKVDFIGMGPINAYSWWTSIFYRSENLLGL